MPYTGKRYYLDLALNAERKLTRDHMLPDGVPASAEALVGNGNVINSHETCDISDYTWTLEQFLLTTGEVRWADKIEKAVFNAGPGAVTKDFRSLQYFSSVNQVIATGRSNHNEFFHGSTWMAFRPTHETECCAGNVHRFMPNYVAHMWIRGKTALLPPRSTDLRPQHSNCRTANNAVSYSKPHTRSTGEIEFSFGLKNRTNISFLLRIPTWCRDAKIYVNGKLWRDACPAGTFVTLRRKFRNGDRIRLCLGMQPAMNTVPGQGIYVQRGPLLFSYPVPQRKTADRTVYANMNGKVPGNPEFECWNIEPAGSWNYALCSDPVIPLKVVRTKSAATGSYPFDPKHTPVKISVPVKQIDWELEKGRYTPRLPTKGIACAVSDCIEYLELIPYGCTELRLTVFPQCN